METLRGGTTICLAWGFFGLTHSLLARELIKRPAERLLGPAFLTGLYRPLYSLLSAILVLWLWYFSTYLSGDILLFRLPGYLYFIPVFGKVTGGALIAACFWKISFTEFTGIGPLIRWLRCDLEGMKPTPLDKLPMAHENEPLATTGVYLWVRHPLNTAAFFWIWAQPAYSLYNVTFAVCLTTYIIIGNRFEERDLFFRYGSEYEQYRTVVPSFFSGLSGLRKRNEKLQCHHKNRKPPPSDL